MTGDTLRVGRALIFLEPDRCPSAHRRDNYRKSRAIRLGTTIKVLLKHPGNPAFYKAEGWAKSVGIAVIS